MKSYPIAQQIQYLNLKAEVDTLLLELQHKSSHCLYINGIKAEDWAYSRETSWKAA